MSRVLWWLLLSILPIAVGVPDMYTLNPSGSALHANVIAGWQALHFRFFEHELHSFRTTSSSHTLKHPAYMGHNQCISKLFQRRSFGGTTAGWKHCTSVWFERFI
ncbi:hypothetical protein F5878DRAFT_607910 [Lentinula raphanica]|uniref:Secreted protein n=1 Tax=Lentinula raphanica TaxID=153919 RepID=A0AA38UI74_9AGAR|nr:hypothetical protein F5878DRAFT_607910 [Lentinula raphanica]